EANRVSVSAATSTAAASWVQCGLCRRSRSHRGQPPAGWGSWSARSSPKSIGVFVIPGHASAYLSGCHPTVDQRPGWRSSVVDPPDGEVGAVFLSEATQTYEIGPG